MNELHEALARKVAQRFGQLPEVCGVAVAGSQASGAASAESDIDLYVYARSELPSTLRMAIGVEFSNDVVLNDFWGQGNEWTDRETGIHVDAVFLTDGWITDHLHRVLVRHESSMGYSTCFWHTVSISEILFDRDQWLSALQKWAIQPYPEPLVKAIIANNYPVLRQIPSSYLRQLEKAASRNDLVSLNHRTAALFASYFDILFAINRVPHPGEKRQIDLAEKLCLKQPATMRAEIKAVLESSVNNAPGIGSTVNQLVDSLDRLLGAEGVHPDQA